MNTSRLKNVFSFKHNRSTPSAPYLNSFQSSHFTKGFTLIELVIVMVILGVFGAFVIPRLVSVSSVDQLMEYEYLKSQLAYARTSAVASGCFTSVDIASQSAEMFRDSDCNQMNGWCFTSSVLMPGQNQAYVNAYSAVIIPSTIRLVFSPQGGIYQSTDLGNCITLANVTQGVGNLSLSIGTRSILLDYQTGLVR